VLAIANGAVMMPFMTASLAAPDGEATANPEPFTDTELYPLTVSLQNR
jgi:hypothetical protein